MKSMLALVALVLTLTAVGGGGEVLIMTYPRASTPSSNGDRAVVPDPEAHGGNAQAGLVASFKPGQTIGSFYGYARPAGRYEITWRVKVRDNTSDQVVFKAASYDESRRNLYKIGSIQVKGTDFKAPNAYQEFSFMAEKGEGGFFGDVISWMGQTDVLVDWCRIRSVEFFDERDSVSRTGGIKLPEVWRLPPPDPLRVHVAKGIWWNMLGISESLAWRGGGLMDSSYFGQGQWGASLRGFPANGEALMEENAVLLVNVSARALGPAGRLYLEEYVTHGGGLLICGGRFALTAGNYGHTALERLLPCEFDDKDRQHDDAGLVVAPTEPGKRLLGDLPWELQPRVYYFHRTQPRPGADVWLTAGDVPLLTVWKVGEGRVAFWAGSVEGDPPADQLAFWEWGGLPACMDRTLTWLTEQQVAGHTTFDPEVDGKAIDELATLALEKNADARANTIVRQLAARCHDAEFARQLMQGLALADVQLSRPAVDLLAATAQPFVDASWGALADELARSSSSPGKSGLGLRILGMSRADGAGDALSKQTRPSNSGSALDSMGDANLGGSQRRLIGAVEGLGDLGDPARLPELTRVRQRLGAHLPDEGETSIIADLNEEAYQQALVSSLKLGDETAAKPLVTALMKNILTIEHYQNYLDVMLLNKDDVALIQGRKRAVVRLPVLHQRQRALMATMKRLPQSVMPALAAAVAERNDAVLLPFAYSAFAPRDGETLTDATVRGMTPLVTDTNVVELRILGCRALQRSAQPGALAEVLLQLAKSESPVDARFAVMRSTMLDKAGRKAVLEAAAAHADESVRRLAGLYAR